MWSRFFSWNVKPKEEPTERKKCDDCGCFYIPDCDDEGKCPDCDYHATRSYWSDYDERKKKAEQDELADRIAEKILERLSGQKPNKSNDDIS